MLVHSTEVLLWQPSYSLPDQSLLAWDGAWLAVPGVVPSLVLELARSQLKSLLGVASPGSSGLEEEEAQLELASELYPDGVDERP